MSDVEVWRRTPTTPIHGPLEPLVLTEDATQTLGGLLESTKAVIGETARLLIEVWRWRRNNPQILTQPAAQWPNGPATTPTSVFQGYAPRSRDISSSMAPVHPIVMRRFLAASLDDASRSQWDAFD
jgi:hypothetical protein